MSSMRHALLIATSVIALAVLGGTGTAAATTNCDGLTNLRYTPGLTFTPQSATLAASSVYARCVSTDRPDITGGTYSANLTNPAASCLNLLGSTSGTRTYHWNTGETSTVTYVDTNSVVAGNLVVEQLGTVTSGVFAGQTSSGTLTLTGNFLNCLTPGGLTTLAGPNVLLIT
ncbi:hypothetical protein [Conexibacter woesei]|uniref:hypothetical protein n=1 Tax=Conexibacter woesei TaxID=191495 RepID=UPI00041A3110|nr:hypothetical protein [Conexibacter woesei]